MATELVPTLPGRPAWVRDADGWQVCLAIHDQWHLAERGRLLRRLAAEHPDRRGRTPDDVGIYRHRDGDGYATGWQAVVRLGRTRTIRKCFPKGTPLDAMRQWRADVRAERDVQRSGWTEAQRRAAAKLEAFDRAERHWYDVHGLVPPPGGTKAAIVKRRSHPFNSKQERLSA